MRLVVVAVMFLLIGAFSIISNYNLHLGKAEDLNLFSRLYISWLDTLTAHAKTLTAFVVRSDWLPASNATHP
ncbi:hypothetical protein KW805_01345 [Candidatus Pacearchaeota archaeon]|nr:hypothetical protein [Candidatus Pacearchaeota archaeon]